MLSECQDPTEVQDLPSCLDFHLADIYSLGLLVIELATLSEAYRFFDCTGQIIGDEIQTRLSIMRDNYSYALVSIIESMLGQVCVRETASQLLRRLETTNWVKTEKTGKSDHQEDGYISEQNRLINEHEQTLDHQALETASFIQVDGEEADLEVEVVDDGEDHYLDQSVSEKELYIKFEEADKISSKGHSEDGKMEDDYHHDFTLSDVKQKQIRNSELSPGSYYENTKQVKHAKLILLIDEPIRVFDSTLMTYKSNIQEDWPQRHQSFTNFDYQHTKENENNQIIEHNMTEMRYSAPIQGSLDRPQRFAHRGEVSIDNQHKTDFVNNPNTSDDQGTSSRLQNPAKDTRLQVESGVWKTISNEYDDHSSLDAASRNQSRAQQGVQETANPKEEERPLQTIQERTEQVTKPKNEAGQLLERDGNSKLLQQDAQNDCNR